MLHFAIEARLALAEIEIADGNPEQANVHLRAAEGLNPDTAAGWDPWFVQIRAELALFAGQPSDACRLAEQAVAATDDGMSVANRCSPLAVLGRAQLACAEPTLAAATFERLIATAGIGPYPCRRAEGHEGAAAAALALGSPDTARRHLADASEIRGQTGSRPVPRPAVDEHLVPLAAERPIATIDVAVGSDGH
jgi:hypothetical protein